MSIVSNLFGRFTNTKTIERQKLESDRTQLDEESVPPYNRVLDELEKLGEMMQDRRVEGIPPH